MSQFIVTIDDSPTVRKILEFSLQRAGWPSASFQDGEQAICALLEGRIPPPTAILIDVCLPNLDGYAVARALRRMKGLKQTAIILLSGRTGWVDRILRARWAGASAYLTKPFQPQQVIAVVRDLVAHPNARTARAIREEGSDA